MLRESARLEEQAARKQTRVVLALTKPSIAVLCERLLTYQEMRLSYLIRDLVKYLAEKCELGYGYRSIICDTL